MPPSIALQNAQSQQWVWFTDHRPIELGSIFTGILATSLSPILKNVVRDSHSEFVPGRSIHNTIDLALAKKLAKSGRFSRDVLVLLLDFSKAYDSVDRDFLMEALRWQLLSAAPRYRIAIVCGADTMQSES